MRSFSDLERSATLGHTSEGLRSLIVSLIKDRSSRMLVFCGLANAGVFSQLSPSNKRLQCF